MARWLKVEEAAEAHRVEPETIRRWIRAGRLPATRNPAGHYRVAEEDLLLALDPARDLGPERPVAPKGGRGGRREHPGEVDRGGEPARAQPK